MEDEFRYGGEERNLPPNDVYNTFENFWGEYDDIYHNEMADLSSLTVKLEDVKKRLNDDPSRDEKKRLQLSRKVLEKKIEKQGGAETLEKIDSLGDKMFDYLELKNEELDKTISDLEKIDLSSKTKDELIEGINFWRNDLYTNEEYKRKIMQKGKHDSIKDGFIKIYAKKILVSLGYLKKFMDQKSLLEEKELEEFNATPQIDADIDSIRDEVPRSVLEDLENLKKKDSDLPEKKEEVKNLMDELLDEVELREKVESIIDDETGLQEYRDTHWEGYDIKKFINRLDEKNLKTLLNNQLDNSLNPSVEDREAHVEFLLEAFDNQILLDQVYDSMWEDRIQYEERNKFRWSQASTLINIALTDADARVYIDPDNSYLYDVLKTRMNFSYDAETHEITEITLDGETLISTDSSNQPVISPENVKLLENIILKISDQNVKSKIIQEFGSSVNAKYVVESLILDIREEQKELIKNSETPKELEKNIEKINEKSKLITDLKKNVRANIFRNLKKGILGSARKLSKFLNEHRGEIKALGALSAAGGILVLILKFILPLENNLRKAKVAVENHIRELGKNLNEKMGPLYVMHEIIQSLYKTYSKIQGVISIFLSFLSFFLSLISLFYLKISVKTYSGWINYIQKNISFGKTLLLGIVNLVFLLSGIFSLLLLTFILIKWRKKKFP